MVPAPIFCTERTALLQEFTRAVSEYLRMQSAQASAAMRGEGFLFETEIKAARKPKDQAKRAVEEHQKKHGC